MPRKKAAKPVQDTTVDMTSTLASYESLLAAMRANMVGQWSANLLELSRHFTSAAFLAINTLANQAAASEVKAMERTPDPHDGDEELLWSEPLCQLIDNPNDDDSFSDVLYQITQQLSMTGIALVWMPSSTLGTPEELYVIPSASATPMPPSPQYPRGSYQIQPYWFNGWFSAIPSYQSSAGARIPAEQIIRVKNHHPYLRYDGYAVLSAVKRQIDVIDSIDSSRLNQQITGADPTMTIEFDANAYNPDEADLKRFRTQFENLYAGPLGRRIMPLPPGVKANNIGKSPSEMAYVDGWSQLVDFTLAAYGVPKSVAGLQDDVSYATLYASLKQFNILSLQPLLRKISDKFNKALVRPFYGNDLYLMITPQSIEDTELIEKQLQLDLTGGVRTLNEWRDIRKLAPVPGDEGDRWVVPNRNTEKDTIQETDPQMMATVGSPDERQIDRERPENDQGDGSQGSQPDKFASVLDRFKSKGIIGEATT